MNQIANNLTGEVDGILRGKRYLIHDRDPLFTSEFLKTLNEASVKLPARSLKLNAFAERLRAHDQGVAPGAPDLFGEGSVLRATAEFTMRYHQRTQSTGARQRVDLRVSEHRLSGAAN